jgi:hypothetical protein
MTGNKFLKICLVVAVFSAFAFSMSGIRAQEIGWQYDTFDENLVWHISPESPTSDEPMVVTVYSVYPGVYLSDAHFHAIIEPDEGLPFEYQNTFQRVNNTEMRCTVGPFAYKGFDISFYILAYDWQNIKMDSYESYNYIHYYVGGPGWKYQSFDENIDLTYTPLTVNATEEVTVTITSIHNVTMKGANLWWTYLTPEGELVTGVGDNFTHSNTEMTQMTQTIRGYSAGTNVTFWVQAWDVYVDQIISEEYNYSVLGLMQYTDFPFEYTDDGSGNLDRSKWYPDLQILLSMVGMCAIGVPLFLYLYVIAKKKEERVETLVVSDGTKEETVVSTKEVTKVATKKRGERPDKP